MSTIPRSPRVHKGALLGLDPFNPAASVIVFQYNPETLSRTLTLRASGAEAETSEALRITGPPSETISVSVEIDAADQLEQGSESAGKMGIHPALASLEMLLYPKSSAHHRQRGAGARWHHRDHPRPRRRSRSSFGVRSGSYP